MSVRIEVSSQVATITIDRPERMNALDEPTRLALANAIRNSANDSAIDAIVITGAGRAFCAGQDLAAIHELDDCHDTVARTYNPIVEAIVDADVPVIAAVNGAAVGAGMGVALACDVVLMSDRASFACVFGKVGLVPDTGVSWQLVRAIGYARAYDLALSGRRIGAEEALSLGLATEVVAGTELERRATERAAELAAGARLAQTLTKRVLRAAVAGSLGEVLKLEARSQGLAGGDTEHRRRREEFLTR